MYMDYFAHAGHDHGAAQTEVASATSSLDTADFILILIALALITAAIVLIIFVAGSVKRLKQIDGTQKTKKAAESQHKS